MLLTFFRNNSVWRTFFLNELSSSKISLQSMVCSGRAVSEKPPFSIACAQVARTELANDAPFGAGILLNFTASGGVGIAQWEPKQRPLEFVDHVTPKEHVWLDLVAETPGKVRSRLPSPSIHPLSLPTRTA